MAQPAPIRKPLGACFVRRAAISLQYAAPSISLYPSLWSLYRRTSIVVIMSGTSSGSVSGSVGASVGSSGSMGSRGTSSATGGSGSSEGVVGGSVVSGIVASVLGSVDSTVGTVSYGTCSADVVIETKPITSKNAISPARAIFQLFVMFVLLIEYAVKPRSLYLSALLTSLRRWLRYWGYKALYCARNRAQCLTLVYLSTRRFCNGEML